MKKENQKVILLVEDDKQLQEVLYKKLSNQEKYKILVADDGEEGLRMAKDFTPDLILLDLILPKLDGVEVLKKIRNEECCKDTKIIVLSNLTYLGDDIEDLEEKVQDHLVKTNTALEEITKKIEEVLLR